MTQPTFDRETDLLVAGAGPGGMAAALVASLEGLDVVIAEKSEQVGGTAATSAGTLWIPGNRQSLAAGWTDSAADAERYMDALTGGPEAPNRRLREAYLASGPEVIDDLMRRTEVQFVPCGKHPDYQSNRPGAAVAGRAIVARMFDGRLLGPDFERVRPPIREFMVFGGMMVGKDDIPRLLGRFKSVANFIHAGKLFARYLKDRLRYSRGTRVVMGNALVARLFYSLKRQDVPILFGAGIVELIQGPRGVEGAVIETATGRLRIRARRGVVLATGGYAHDQQLRNAFMPQPVTPLSLAAAPDTGDGIRLGQGLGARVAPGEHGSGAFWTPVSKVPRRDGTQGLFPHLSLDRAKPGLIAVNREGRRFVDEGASYHDFVEAMYATRSIPAFLVCTAGFVRRYGIGPVHPGTRDLQPFADSGYLTLAPTLEALARRLGLDPAVLAATVARHNGFARTGRDEDFGKGESELSRFNGDAGHGPNPCLAPLETGPFCAVEVFPAEIACSTGLSTDEDARVLNGAGEVIPGLYACGNDMASIMAGTYPGPGTTLGPAIVFAWRAARHAAGCVPQQQQERRLRAV
ncbi:FAD-dependent oxidoreductase [Zavarzinia compransoris]|uniref:FAD-binding dehydrogenase n=1 Tax=Zavarzinia compransoris TaxID=1264899 RepID=A0A317E1N1_9PROT|nr:FAD-dependent oxidoreductase [Zavarzinia compransoris]PWR20997.1 FAD-binding dehydrogenase [Zavarzinia compransoris]TDP44029.1 succinate dehydrogenase/fumarate reductase flavoprotein subunit [Zavarzinia compransoris]